jgi:hypothetical protein
MRGAPVGGLVHPAQQVHRDPRSGDLVVSVGLTQPVEDLGGHVLTEPLLADSQHPA